ncbi:uncharacterized protein [Euwallacea similis]|uniref:uncharacterized protein n=1 Tax=Euwallacea similis TaxID=1736056 RepID=UPI003450D4BD
MTQNRKRTRSFQDETDFMPLSKRINNLHINNMLTDPNAHMGPNPPWGQLNGQSLPLPESPSGSEQSIEWNYSPQSQYCPDLNESQNPHYFNINKLLYEMYVERMSRGCHQI